MQAASRLGLNFVTAHANFEELVVAEIVGSGALRRTCIEIGQRDARMGNDPRSWVGSRAQNGGGLELAE